MTSIKAIRNHHLKHQNPLLYEDEYIAVYCNVNSNEFDAILIYPKYWKENSDISGCDFPIDEFGEPLYLTLNQYDQIAGSFLKLMMKLAKKRYEKFQKATGEIA